MSRKTIAAVLAVMIFITSGCANIQVKIQGSRKMSENEPVAVSSEEDNRAVNSEIGGGKPWIDSDIKENISADTPVDPKDDFHLYVNKEWILKNEIPDGYFVWSPYHERTLEVKNQCIDLLTDDSLTGHDAELIQTYNSLILDWDARNASGVSEIQKLYDEIMGITDIEDITRLITDGKTTDKLYSFVSYGPFLGMNDTERYIVFIDSPALLLNDSAEYKERSEYGDIYYGYYRDLFIYLVGRMGMNESRAKKCFDNAIGLEAALSDRIYTTMEQHNVDFMEKINNEMSFNDATNLAKVFPLEEILTASGYKYDGMYMVVRPDYIEMLDEIYTEENTEKIRDLMLVKYLLDHSGHLDKDTYDRKCELTETYFGTSGTLADDEMACDRVKSMLPTSMQKVYISKYGSDEDRKKMEDLCREVINTYKEMMTENEWASDEVKNYTIEKLDKITIHAGYPDRFRDTSNIDISGCSLIEADEKINQSKQDYQKSLPGTVKNREMWAEDLAYDLLNCNASYIPNKNDIYMVIGMMGEPFYSSNMSIEELYASIGAFWVGHEISHAFDSNGAQFDAQGKFRDWWPEKDKEEFQKRVKKVDDYLDTIVAFGDKHFIGSSIDTESIADTAGLQCALRMASKIDGFDYDRFFVKYAEMNAMLTLYSYELSSLLQDNHPLNYSRTNVPLQQFEEFYETYDVKAGDNMYLAPEDRLLIW